MVQLFLNEGRPSVAMMHSTGGVTVRKEDVCERALKRYEEGDGNTQSTNGVVCRRRTYRLRNVIDWRSPMISEAVGRCEHSTNDICRRRVGSVRVHDLPP